MAGIVLVHNDVIGTTGGGTQYIIVRMPVGKRLKNAFARNATRPFQQVQIYLTETSVPYDTAAYPSSLPGHILLAQGFQPGKQGCIIWNGDIELSDSYRTLMAVFWNCSTAGDSLGIGGALEL